MVWFRRTPKQEGVLTKTQKTFSRLIGMLKGKKKLDQEDVNKIKRLLIEADVGLNESMAVIQHLESVLAQGVQDEQELVGELRKYLEALFPDGPLELLGNPAVILMIGVNGAGKTTTIAKLSQYFQQQGHRVAVASGDTYRAAADEQLQHWAKETNAIFIDRGETKDPAAVMYDAYFKAKEQNATILLADTSGRMHGNQGLIDQLKKVKRVLGKAAADPVQTWLILDGSLGKSNLVQAEMFHESLSADGLVVTKLDGSAKGGALFSIVKQLNLPVFFVGLGESADDIKKFDAAWFVNQVVAE